MAFKRLKDMSRIGARHKTICNYCSVVVAVLVDDALAGSVLGVVVVSVDITGAVVVLAITTCVEVAAD